MTFEAPKTILARHGLRPKKDWGQNFLGDEEVLSDIAAACTLDAKDTVVELGAGLGHLTRALAETHAQVVAVERDRELVPVLEAELKALPNVRIVAGNAAELDFAKTAGVDRPVVAGNLPYHLSSSILFEVLDQRPHVARAVFLLQKEVAERIAAGPGHRDYGILSALLQAYCTVEVMFDVPRGRFHPPPNVDSSVVRIDVLDTPRAAIGDHAQFVRVVKAAFAQRRKTLSNALKGATGLDSATVQQALAQANVDGVRRAETLYPEEFARIAAALPKLHGKQHDGD